MPFRPRRARRPRPLPLAELADLARALDLVGEDGAEVVVAAPGAGSRSRRLDRDRRTGRTSVFPPAGGVLTQH